MKEIVSKIGSLKCNIILAPGEVSNIFILCHGFGAQGSDLVPLARELARNIPKTNFVMPEGPLDLSEQFPLADARAWWHINVGHVATAIAAGRFNEIQESVPEGLASARRKLMGTMDLLSNQYGIPLGNFILGGFSQGAMLTTDVALSMEEAPLALSILSGTLICKNRWSRLAQKRQQLKVFQSHGQTDPVLPYSNAIALKEFLEAHKIIPNFTSFGGQHTIPGNVVSDFENFLISTVQKAPAD